MSSKYRQLKQRTLTALVAMPIIIIAIYWSAWSYFLFFLLVAVLATLEFHQLARLGGICLPKLEGIAIGLFVYTLVFLWASGHMSIKYLYILCPAIALIFTIELYEKSTAPFTNIAYVLLSIVYINVPFALLHVAAFTQGTYSPEIVIGILLLLWANDVGAYLVGAGMGKRKLFKRISPQKSWEGSLGGGGCTLVTGYVLAHCTTTALSLGAWLGMGSIVIIAGTYGDLVESMLKRSLEIKDAGALLPGHGGVLDRCDSFLLAMPCLIAFIKLL